MVRMEQARAEPSNYAFPASTVRVAEEKPAAVVDFRGITSTLWRQRRILLIAVLTGGLLGIVAAILVPARYTATTEVFLDPRNLAVLQNEVNPAVGNGDESSIISQSQVQLVRSTNVLKSVVVTMQLDKDPDFGAPAPGLVDMVRRALFGSGEAGETREVKAMRALARDLNVRRTDKTFVIEIGVTTSDADKSAEVANTVASAFISEVSRSRADEVKRSGESLDGRLEQLRARLKTSDDAVERYRREHDLIGSGGRLVTDQQLGELTTQLSNAQNAVAEAKSRLEAVRQLSRGDGMPADTNEAVRSPALAAIRATLAQAMRAADEAAVIYGPLYPLTKELAVRVRATRQQLNAEIARINRAALSDYQRTKATVAQLAAKLASLKETSGTANEASVELRELEREAASNRAVYEAFLNRTKDLQQRLYLDTVNARVVTVAMPPLTRAGLSKTIIVMIGLFIGLLLGTILALLRDRGEPLEARYGAGL